MHTTIGIASKKKRNQPKVVELKRPQAAKAEHGPEYGDRHQHRGLACDCRVGHCGGGRDADDRLHTDQSRRDHHPLATASRPPGRLD